MITVSNLSKKYKHAVLENISFTINRGDICCVLGKPGAGKSTLLNIIAGETKPDSGEIILNNIPLKRNTNFQHLKIGIVNQADQLPGQFTGYQFLEFRCLIYNISKQTTTERIKILTEYFFEDPAELNKFPFTYSASTTMGLKIIASLVHHPDILLLDEPFEKIHPATTDKLVALLKTMNKKKNCTTLITAKNLAYAEQIATHVLYLRNTSISSLENKETL